MMVTHSVEMVLQSYEESLCIEIEKIYTLLYIHPCNYFEILEIIKIEEYETFINGI